MVQIQNGFKPTATTTQGAEILFSTVAVEFAIKAPNYGRLRKQDCDVQQATDFLSL